MSLSTYDSFSSIVHRNWIQGGAAVLVLLDIINLDDTSALEARSSLKHSFLEVHNICTAEYVQLCTFIYVSQTIVPPPDLRTICFCQYTAPYVSKKCCNLLLPNLVVIPHIFCFTAARKRTRPALFTTTCCVQ